MGSRVPVARLLPTALLQQHHQHLPDQGALHTPEGCCASCRRKGRGRMAPAKLVV